MTGVGGQGGGGGPSGRNVYYIAGKGVCMGGVKNALRIAEDSTVGERFRGVGEMYWWVGEKCKRAGENQYNHIVRNEHEIC